MPSVSTGTPAGQASRSRSRRPSRAATRPTVARDRAVQGGQRGGQVAGHGAGPGAGEQGGGLGVQPADAVEHEVGQEGVEVGEVPVQDTLGAARLGGDRAAGERVGPGAAAGRARRRRTVARARRGWPPRSAPCSPSPEFTVSVPR